MPKRFAVAIPCALLAILLMTIVPRAGHAAGFFLTQQSVDGIGRAFAGGAAIASDASTIFTNPAGMTQLEKAEIAVGTSVLLPVTDFDNRGSTATTPGTGGATLPYQGEGGGNPFSPKAVPHFYGAFPLGDGDVWLGLGITMPFGLSVAYPSDWFGRYDSIKGDLKTVDIQPTVAVRLADWISVGGGINVQYARAKLTNAIPNPLAVGGPTAATDGRNRLKGDDWSAGGNVGVLVTPWPSTRIGVHYRSRINHTLEGSNKVSGLSGPLAPANGSVDGKTNLRLPDIVSVAIAQELGEEWTVLAEWQWFNWSRFDEVRIRREGDQSDLTIPEGYTDSYAWAAGVVYAPGPRWRWRMGVRYETSPVRNRYRTTTVPDSTNYSIGVGASADVAKGVQVQASLFQTIWDSAKVDLTRQFFEGTAAESQVAVKGKAQSSSTTIALGVRFTF